MQITLNGEKTNIEERTVEELLEALQINARHSAVEVNTALVPREIHAACILQEGDQVEIVTLVGGG